MPSERRFLTGMRETDTDEAGLVLEDDGGVWKVAADGIRTEVAASDGGSSPLLIATKVLTNDDILALATTPFEIVPAVGSDVTIQFISARLFLDARAGAYDPPGGSDLRSGELMVYAGAPFASSVSSPFGTPGSGGAFSDFMQDSGGILLADAGPQYQYPFSPGTYGPLLPLALSISYDPPSALQGALTLRMFNQTDGVDVPLTGGDPANALSITVLYGLIPVPFA